MQDNSFTKDAAPLNGKYPTEYRKYTAEDYKKLNEQIKLYKQGNAEAADYIVAVYHAMLKKYTDFICFKNTHKGVQLDASSVLHKFIRLYIRGYSKMTKEEKDEAYCATCMMIADTFSKFEYLDIYNELVCVLLNMASKYKVLEPGDKYYKENGTFHMYVKRCFHYDVFNALKKIAGDPLVMFKGIYAIEEKADYEADTYRYTHDGIIDSINRIAVLKSQDSDILFEKVIHAADRMNDIKKSVLITKKEKGGPETDPYEDASLNFNWTNGVTCSSEFMTLTPYEREILVLTYVDKVYDDEISKRYGYHRVTIVKHRKIALEKLRRALKEKEERGT